jgi:hypothetical protein
MLKKCVSVVHKLLGKNSYKWSIFEYGLTYFRAHSLESLVEGHIWFLNQFVEIYHCLLLISFGKSRFKPLRSAVHDYRLWKLTIRPRGMSALLQITGSLFLQHEPIFRHWFPQEGTTIPRRVTKFTQLTTVFFIFQHELTCRQWCPQKRTTLPRRVTKFTQLTTGFLDFSARVDLPPVVPPEEDDNAAQSSKIHTANNWVSLFFSTS